jgi:hypothetical protein
VSKGGPALHNFIWVVLDIPPDRASRNRDLITIFSHLCKSIREIRGLSSVQTQAMSSL